jgi:hypothetical protein
MSTAPLLDLGILSAFRVWGSLPCSRGGNGQAFKALQGSVLVSCTRSSQEENDPHTGETGQATSLSATPTDGARSQNVKR